MEKEELISKVLKSLHLTEKAQRFQKENQYVFEVWEKANKEMVKKAVEALYGVKVVSVKIINLPPKRRRLGKSRGWKKGIKKAIVRLKEGQKIEIFPK